MEQDNLEDLRIEQKSALSKLPIQNKSKISQNKNPHNDKLDIFAEGQSRRYKFSRKSNKPLGAFKINQSLEDRRESIAIDKIFAKLRKDSQTIDALKKKLKDNTNCYEFEDQNRNSFEEKNNI